MCGFQSLFHSIHRDFREYRFDCFDCGDGVVDLTITRDADFIFLAEIVKCCACKVAFDTFKSVGTGDYEFGLRLNRERTNYIHNLFVLIRIKHSFTAGINNTAFFKCNLADVVAESVGMVKSDLRYNTAKRGAYNICRVSPSAESDLKHNHIAFFF